MSKESIINSLKKVKAYGSLPYTHDIDETEGKHFRLMNQLHTLTTGQNKIEWETYLGSLMCILQSDLEGYLVLPVIRHLDVGRFSICFSECGNEVPITAAYKFSLDDIESKACAFFRAYVEARQYIK